jgi:hypothetical protein
VFAYFIGLFFISLFIFLPIEWLIRKTVKKFKQRAKEFVKDGFTPGEAKLIGFIAFVIYTVSFLFFYYQRFNSFWLGVFAYFIGLHFIFPPIEWLIRKTVKIFKKLRKIEL